MTSGAWRIGAVAQRIGVPAATLRTWERRYGVVDPHRTAGRDRLYSDEDVERLELIAWLKDRGERVADVARLDLDALASRRAAWADERVPAPERSSVVRAVLVGRVPSVAGLAPDGRATVEVVGEHPRLDAVQGPLDGRVALVELAALGDDPVAGVRELEARGIDGVVVVLTGFLRQRVVEHLLAAGARVLRGPARDVEARQALVDLAASRSVGAAAPAARRIDRDALHQLVQRPPQLACECPNHLAGLVIALDEFEQYSRACESRSPQDAALHAQLAQGTAQARAIVETLLVRVCAEEGVHIWWRQDFE